MAQNNRNEKNIPGWLIFIGFMFGFWPGMILLLIRILSDRKEEKEDIRRQMKSLDWTPDIEWSADGTYRSRSYTRTAAGTAPKKSGHRVYQPPKSGQRPVERTAAKSAEYSAKVFQQAGTYANVNTGKVRRKTDGKKQNPREKVSRILSYKSGKTLRVVGTVLLSLGLVMAILTIAMGIDYYDPLLEIIADTMLMAGPLSGAGSVMLIYGNKKRKRVLRCRTYASMIGKRRCVSIDQLAGAVGLKYDKCCEDLNWMLGEGLYPGMYIDHASHSLTYYDAAPEAPAEQPEPEETPRSKAAPDGTFPEELAIRQLNDEIQDPHVSEKMDRLEALTHKILAYAQLHPEKEPDLRQFRTYYLPKTMHILEAYARMERTGIAGGNINAAMQDVEKIMDKLVQGFEKQLDALFDSEAMDVITDISVLENMMKLSGMTDLDPFGTNASDDGQSELKL